MLLKGGIKKIMGKHNREVLQKLMKSKLMLTLIGLFAVSLIATGTAYYVMSYQSLATYTISGGVSMFGVTQDLSDASIDVSVDLENTQQIILENDNGNLTMFYNMTKNINNTDSGNCDEEGDVIFELKKDSIEISEGGNFTMIEGTNTFDFTATAINDRVCPATIDVQIDFTE